MLPVLKKAATIVGGGAPNYTKLAEMIGCQRPALYVWVRVPIPYIQKIVKATDSKVTPEMLRPDIFRELA